MRDADFAEPVFASVRHFEKGGIAVAVIGQAFPYTPIANPRWMMPNWSFGIREAGVRRSVAEAREQGAQVVVLLSHNGFDVDAKLAARVEGIDIILTAHTHDALPQPTARRQHAARRLGLARQVPLAPRRGGGRRAREATFPTR